MTKRIVFGLILVFVVAVFCGCGYGDRVPPNDEFYSIENTDSLGDSVITGKTIYWLGSSVTLGYASENVSMADYIAKRNGAVCVKEAVSGTTLRDVPVRSGCDTVENSYVYRMENSAVFDKDEKIDLFVCQISSNDAMKDGALGSVTADDKKAIGDFDKTTTMGAVEYIIAYALSVWDCEIMLFTGAHYSNDTYAKMVEMSARVASKWGAALVDLYSDEEFNNISAEDRRYYMKDDVHPYRSGYREWWTPKFEEVMKEVFAV